MIGAMVFYILKRLLLMIPTIFGILLVSFIIIQFVPGGPVEKMIAQIQGHDSSATSRFSGGGPGDVSTSASATASAGQASQYRGAQGLDPEFIKDLEKMYGFDKPAHERFILMLGNYLTFNLGESYYRDVDVLSLIFEKMPVSISLGLWTFILIYTISIPLGIRKAVHDGSAFDVWTSAVIFVGYSIPSFVMGVLLIVLFAGGYWDFFPLRGLTSDNWEELSMMGKVLDYLWHLVLPITAMVIGGFASLTMLTKNSFIDEIGKQYVLTARAKGLEQKQVLYGHVFRNAMLIVIAGFPAAFVHIFFTGNMLIEIIFSLDGLGQLGYKSIVDRDYPVVLGNLYFLSLIGLVVHLMRDLVYVWVDPRIDFASQGH